LTQSWTIHAPGTKPNGPPVTTNTIDPGSYQILNVAGGLALSSANHACKVNGDALIQDPYTPSADQIWTVNHKSNDSYTLVNNCSLSLTDPNASTRDGTGLTQFTTTKGAASQSWVLAPVTGSNNWTMKSAISGLYATLTGTGAGATVVQRAADGKDALGNAVPGPDQQWSFNSSKGAAPQPGGGKSNSANQVTAGAYQLVNSATGLALGSAKNDCKVNGTGLVQDQYQGAKSQVWNISYNGNNTYSVGNNCPMSLTVPNASTVSGTQLTQTTKDGTVGQLWKLTPIAGSNNWALQSYPTNQYITPTGNEVGSKVVEQSPTGPDNAPAADQQWRLVVATTLVGPPTGGGTNQVSDGTYELANASTKTALGVTGHDCATAGTKLNLDQYHGNKDQLWKVTDNHNGTYTVINRCPMAATNPASSTQTGSGLTQATPAAGDASQLWILAPVGGTGHWTVQSYASNLYVTAGGTGVAAPVVQQALDGTDAGTSGVDQEWDLILAPPATNAPPTDNNDQITKGIYEVANVASGLSAGSDKHTCVTDGTRLTVDQYHGSNDQLWTISRNADGTYTLVNQCPLSATNPNSSTTSGAALTEAKSSTPASQRWVIKPVAGSGHWTIQIWPATST
jgi:hypothetical protein